MTNLQDDENMRLNQSIQKMQERLDETFLRASDTKQMGRAIIKNTEDLLRGSNKDQRELEVNSLLLLLLFYYQTFSFFAQTMVLFELISSILLTGTLIL